MKRPRRRLRHSLFITLVFWLLALARTSTLAADASSFANVFIGPWLVAGPVEIGDFSALEEISPVDFNRAAAGAAVTWHGREWRWREHRQSFLDFNRFFDNPGHNTPQAACAVAVVQSPVEGPFSLAIGAHDVARVWWNGELVQGGGRLGGFKMDDEQSLVWVKRGENRIVLQCFSRLGFFRAAARLLPLGEEHVGVAASLGLDGIRVNGEAVTAASQAAYWDAASSAPAPRRAIPLASFMPQSPLPALEFTITDGGGAIRHTGAVSGYAGQWIAALPPHFSFAGASLADARLSVRPSAGAPGLAFEEWNGPLAAPPGLVVRGTQSLKLSILNKPDGRPVSGAIVEIGAGWQAGLFVEGRSTPDGQCRIDGLPPGAIPVRVSAPGFGPAARIVYVSASLPVSEATIHLDASAPVTSRGFLVWQDSQQPMTGARLRWTSDMQYGLFVEADAQGEFALRGARGSVPVTVIYGAFSSTLTRLGADVESPPQSIVPMCWRALMGQALDADGRPLEGAWLMMENFRREQIGAVAGDGGQITLQHNLEGTATLALRAPGVMAFEKIPADAAVWEREWRLGGDDFKSVSGMITAKDGAALNGAIIRIGPDERTMDLGLTTASRYDGSFRFRERFPRRPLRLEISAFTSEGESRLIERMLGAGEEFVAMTPERAIRQTWRLAVIDAATSEPLAGVDVKAGRRRGFGIVLPIRRVGPGLFEVGLEWPMPALLAARKPEIEISAPGRQSIIVPMDALPRQPRLESHAAGLPDSARLLRRFPADCFLFSMPGERQTAR